MRIYLIWLRKLCSTCIRHSKIQSEVPSILTKKFTIPLMKSRNSVGESLKLRLRFTSTIQTCHPSKSHTCWDCIILIKAADRCLKSLYAHKFMMRLCSWKWMRISRRYWRRKGKCKKEGSNRRSLRMRMTLQW